VVHKTTPEQAKTGLKQIPLLKGVQSFGMINRLNDEIGIVPEKPVKVDTPVIDGFLVRKVLDPLHNKHPDITYQLETSNGHLNAILIRGPLEAQQVKELTNAARWAFERALTQEAQPQ
jgi:hypothetical protein